jgi:hypothetical protein
MVKRITYRQCTAPAIPTSVTRASVKSRDPSHSIRGLLPAKPHVDHEKKIETIVDILELA